MEEVRRAIEEAAPDLAASLAEAMLAAWLEGGAQAVEGYKPEAEASKSGAEASKSLPVLPAVEAAVAALRSRDLLDRATFASAVTDIQRQAFTVAGVASMEAIQKVRDALVDDLAQGGTLHQFRERLDDTLAGTLLSPAHVETVYRTNVAVAQAQGLEAVLSHPLVDDEFPYVETVPIDDSRLSELCEAASHGGLDNTGVYRRDDPTWKRYAPPRHFRCRCSAIPLNVEDAAAAGVREAQEWLRTGEPPARPQHVDASRLPPLPKGWVPPLA